MKAKPTSTYRRLPPAVWTLIRGAYLAGASAPAVAARFGVSEGVIRKRARAEGWTKAAYAKALEAGDLGRLAQSGDVCGDLTDLSRNAPRSVEIFEGAPRGADAAFARRARAAGMAGLAPVRMAPMTLARKALAHATAAVQAGDGAQAASLARAARAISELDALLPWPEDEDEGWNDDGGQAARQTMMQDMVLELALDLARTLAEGRPLPAPYAAMWDRYPAAERFDPKAWIAQLREEVG